MPSTRQGFDLHNCCFLGQCNISFQLYMEQLGIFGIVCITDTSWKQKLQEVSKVSRK